MSVLDRAIVKAYARQRLSETAAQQAAEHVRAPTTIESVSRGEAAIKTVEDLERLLAQDVDVVAPLERNSLESSLPTVTPTELEQLAVAPATGPKTDATRAVESLIPESPETDAAAAETPVVAADPTHPESALAAVLTDEAPESSPARSAPTAPPDATVPPDATGPPDAIVLESALDVLAFDPPATGAARETATAPTAVDWKWPEICEQLDQFTGDGFRQLAKHLQFAAGQGNKVLAFVGSTANTGRTSIVLTLTRILALEGRTCALLIDADRRHPDLATVTGAAPHIGLMEVAHGQVPFADAVIHRRPGHIDLLPLRNAIADGEWSQAAGSLRALVKQASDEYDLVLIDAGVFGPETRLADCWLRGAADAVITISRQLSDHNTAHEVLNWKQIGIESLGVIETFS